MAYSRTFPRSFLYGPHADRPATSDVIGQVYLSTDQNPRIISQWDGQQWQQIGTVGDGDGLSDHPLDSSYHSDVASISEQAGIMLYHDGSEWKAVSAGNAWELLVPNNSNTPAWRNLSDFPLLWGVDDSDYVLVYDVSTGGNKATQISSLPILGGDTILLYDSGGNPLEEYDATSMGLDYATSDATSGDVVWLPAISISGDHTLAANVHYIGISRWASKLTGEIKLNSGTTLENCTVERTASDSNTIRGIITPSSSTAYIQDCTNTCTQNGSGDSYAVAVISGGDVEVWDSYTYGYSSSGSGYGVYHSSGSAYFHGGRLHGSTGPSNI